MTADISKIPKKARLAMEDYQIKCWDFIVKHKKCGVFLDIGYGKTLTTLAAAASLGVKNILVIAPKSIARTTWHAEAAKWGFPFECVSFVEQPDKKGNLRLLKLSELPPFYGLAAKPSKSTRMFITTRDRIVNLVEWCQAKSLWPFDFVICDEFQSFKGGKTNRTTAVRVLADHTPRLVGLTGTPMPNSLEDVWSEIRILDGGKRLGKYITPFRNRYEYSTMVINGHAVGWKPKEGSMEEVFDKISDIAISVHADLGLPPLTVHDVSVPLPSQALALYAKFKKEGVLHMKHEDLTPANAAVLAAKLLQIASGTVYDDSGKTHVIHSAKLEMAQYLVDNTGGNVIIAYHFRCDKDRLLENIDPGPNNKIVWFDGSEAMKDAWNRGEYKVMLLQPASNCHGINLQDGGSALIWYSIPWSLEHYQQTIGRLYRKGQTKPVVIHRLIAEKTFDTAVAAALARKDTGNSALLDAVRRELDN